MYVYIYTHTHTTWGFGFGVSGVPEASGDWGASRFTVIEGLSASTTLNPLNPKPQNP